MLVPKGVKVGVNTVNGARDGRRRDVRRRRRDGQRRSRDRDSTGGPVNAIERERRRPRASSVASKPTATWSLTTVNGSISVEFGGDFGGDVDIQTVNGSLNTNFDDDGERPVGSASIFARTSASRAGRGIKLETVKGSVELKKAVTFHRSR